MTEAEIRAAALESASRVHEGRATNPYDIIRHADIMAKYVITGSIEPNFK